MWGGDLGIVQHGDKKFGFLVTGTGRPAITQQRLFDRGHISQRKFGVDDFDIADRVDIS